MTFIHKPYKFEKLETEMDGDKRYYLTPTGNKHPSVTTVLSQMLSKEALIAWRERIGDEEADKIMNYASERGKTVHSYCEKYVKEYLTKGEVDENWKEENEVAYGGFLKIKKVMDSKVKIVNNLEFNLWSDRIKTGGTCDVLCQYDYVPSVLDYKTSMKFKKEEWIKKYFLQCCVYALMVYELHGVIIPQMVVVIATDGIDNAQVFVKKTKDYVRETLDIFEKFHGVPSL